PPIYGRTTRTSIRAVTWETPDRYTSHSAVLRSGIHPGAPCAQERERQTRHRTIDPSAEFSLHLPGSSAPCFSHRPSVPDSQKDIFQQLTSYKRTEPDRNRSPQRNLLFESVDFLIPLICA